MAEKGLDNRGLGIGAANREDLYDDMHRRLDVGRTTLVAQQEPILPGVGPSGGPTDASYQPGPATTGNERARSDARSLAALAGSAFDAGARAGLGTQGSTYQHVGGTTPGGGQQSSTVKPATSKKDRRPEPERRADQSDNATYHAMNTKLKLLAYELHAAARKLTFDVAVANANKKPNKAEIEASNAQLMRTIHPLDKMARDTAKQLSNLKTATSEPRLAEGGQYLLAALDDFQPVMTEVDAWMTAHKVEPPSWEVVGRSNGVIKLIFPGIVPAAKPLTSVERSPGFMKDSSINAHLDAAIAAAESMISGNPIIHSDRVILHARELAELLKNHPRVEGQLEPRIKKLITLVDQILVDNPYLKNSFNEAIDPIRNIK